MDGISYYTIYLNDGTTFVALEDPFPIMTFGNSEWVNFTHGKDKSSEWTIRRSAVQGWIYSTPELRQACDNFDKELRKEEETTSWE